jgi:hypothetical protein
LFALLHFKILKLYKKKLKDNSLFNYGMRPVCFSEKNKETKGEGWYRGGYNVSYTKNEIPREYSTN